MLEPEIAMRATLFSKDSIPFFFLLNWDFSKIQRHKSDDFSHLKCTIYEYYIHSDCWATITTIHLQNFFTIPNWNSYPLDNMSLFSSPGKCLVTSVVLCVFMNLPIKLFFMYHVKWKFSPIWMLGYSSIFQLAN